VKRIAWIASFPTAGSKLAENVISNSIQRHEVHANPNTVSTRRVISSHAPHAVNATCDENVAAARPSNLARLHVVHEPEVTNILQESRKFNWRDKSHGGTVGAPSQSVQAQVQANPNARKALPQGPYAFMRQTVFGQESLPEVMSSQIIQEDVGENDKVK
jgi:hypothetical protein